MKTRGSGILLHISSLPSAYGIGDFGPKAYEFADFLEAGKQTYWQILPLTPTDSGLGNSPYSSTSTFALSRWLVNPDILVEEGLLDRNDLDPRPPFPAELVDYPAVESYKGRLLERSWQRFSREGDRESFEQFCRSSEHWLDDYSVFMTLKDLHDGRVWNEWPPEYRNREPGAIRKFREEYRERIERCKFYQYVLFSQWQVLRGYCNARGIRIIGDVPIYVTYDSADVWGNPGIFKLDEKRNPTCVAGVPPDYFSETGQLWGNPVYDWDELRRSNFAWWLRRIGHVLTLCDLLRIDHFRGLVAYWEIPAGKPTAIDGSWAEVPVHDFIGAIRREFSELPIIAEDLGYITPDVQKVITDYGFPGMKVLQFAFGEDDPEHQYLPHNYEPNCVAYTGTHDNNTVKGWFENETDEETRRRLFRYLGREAGTGDIHRALIRLAMSSVSNLVIFPLQDALGLGGEARMNTPAAPAGNWAWRMLDEHMTPQLAAELSEMTWTYGRAPRPDA